MNVLLVEDDDAATSTSMKCSWMKSIRSRRRVEALSKLPGYYNLIISDIRLKKMDSISLLETSHVRSTRFPLS